jgi:hypothetical protein
MLLFLLGIYLGGLIQSIIWAIAVGDSIYWSLCWPISTIFFIVANIFKL